MMSSHQPSGIFARLYNETLFRICRGLVIGLVALGVVIQLFSAWPVATVIAALVLCFGGIAYYIGYENGLSAALKLSYDSECAHVTSKSSWGPVEQEYEANLRMRLRTGGATCARCGWKSGDSLGILPFARACAVCFARIGVEISAERYVVVGTGPYCRFHFEEAKRIMSGELRAFTCDHKSDDEWAVPGRPFARG